MTDSLRLTLNRAIDTQCSSMLAAADYLWQHPETGFREWESSDYLAERFRSLGYVLHMAQNIPGFYCDIDTGRAGPRLLILGELDALKVPGHPSCSLQTGAVHACGHHVQVSALLGIAGALRQPHVLDELSGSIRLMAVPAEELIELDTRQSLREKGIIRYLGGKAEFLYRGYMDHCDIALLVHSYPNPKPLIGLVGGCNGCLLKSVRYIGRAAHAGAFPEYGINALNAAMQGLNAVNNQRELFRNEDHIRFHYILTEGGTSVNTVPESACFEAYVRASSVNAMLHANRQINRALSASAAAFGARVEISDQAGYLPLKNDPTLSQIAADVVLEQFGSEYLLSDPLSILGGCTDMGDLSCVMPTLQAYCSGVTGQCHGTDFAVNDPQTAVVSSARFQLMLAGTLLENDAANAKKVIANAEPTFDNPQAYFAALDTMSRRFDGVVYPGNDTAIIQL